LGLLLFIDDLLRSAIYQNILNDLISYWPLLHLWRRRGMRQMYAFEA
jgi:hypothetical protein